MAYVTPITFVALSTLTAAQLNSIQTNITALWPYSAAGDIPYASAANTLARLAKGTAGQTLRMKADASVPEWSSYGVGCLVYNSTTQAISTSSYTAVLFDSEHFDDAGFHSTSLNTNRITIPSGYSGKYLFGGNITFNTANYSVRILRIRLNGTILLVGSTNTIDGGNDKTSLNASSIYQLNDGDYLEMLVWHNVGNDVNLITEVPSNFWCTKL